jgi:hypothetical protein
MLRRPPAQGWACYALGSNASHTPFDADAAAAVTRRQWLHRTHPDKLDI